MAHQELNIPVNVKLDVDTSTAITCLRLVEAYLNAHAGKTIRIVNKEDGSVGLYFWGASKQAKVAEAHGPEGDRLNAELSGEKMPIYPPHPMDLKKKTGEIQPNVFQPLHGGTEWTGDVAAKINIKTTIDGTEL